VQARLPVWFGGVLHDRNLDRIIRLGDGWIPIMTASLDDVREGAKRLREAAAAAGRSLVDVQAPVAVVRNERGTADPERTAAGVPAAIEAGATDIFFSIAELCADPAKMAGAVEKLGTRIRREVGG
jgi:hypothetical protein